MGLRAERIPIKWTHLIGKESLNTEKLEQVLYRKGRQLLLRIVALAPKLVGTHSGQKFGASEEGAVQCTLKFRATMRPRLEKSMRAWLCNGRASCTWWT
ncbi:MAG: hypothetical protein CR217_12005 [Beijerinckiaceae bacterium]|nr:MAG: hypothetical protein CR217_12005 [Beijerinckiaceae bacterium]